MSAPSPLAGALDLVLAALQPVINAAVATAVSGPAAQVVTAVMAALESSLPMVISAVIPSGVPPTAAELAQLQTDLASLAADITAAGGTTT
jgi:hypothetical protein